MCEIPYEHKTVRVLFDEMLEFLFERDPRRRSEDSRPKKKDETTDKR